MTRAPAAEREAIVRRLLPMVRGIARRVARVVAAADIDDLVGDGCVGLMRAVDTYDGTRGTSLDTYARKLVLGAMLNGMRRLDPVSERTRRTLRRAEAKRNAETHRTGRQVTMAELERKDPGLRRARTAAYRQAPLSLDAPLALESTTLADIRNEPGRLAAAASARRELQQAIALLSERERRVLALHYDHEQSMQTIGTALRVSPQRVSQLHLRAIGTLRAMVPQQLESP